MSVLYMSQGSVNKVVYFWRFWQSFAQVVIDT